MRYWLVMPAAGAGRRFSADIPKQYAMLCGRTVLEWALAPFLGDPRCAGIVVAIATGDRHWQRISERTPSVMAAAGGAERSDSVRSALQALIPRANPTDWVLVHDAARPCLSVEDRDRLLDEVASHPVGGLLAARVTDTLKYSSNGHEIDRTQERAGLWRALTPQMFRHARLLSALERALAERKLPTDEAQALEWVGEYPALIEGSADNLKITSERDLLIAEALLSARRAGNAISGGRGA